MAKCGSRCDLRMSDRRKDRFCRLFCSLNAGFFRKKQFCGGDGDTRKTNAGGGELAGRPLKSEASVCRVKTEP